ncbi:MAG: glycosyltransferase family 9 protein [Proteobacteria bacterium]|nr:glycosyltransferase family 9 protein [Pseudomonadota bacterium]
MSRITRICRSNRYDVIFDAHCSLRSRLLLVRCFGPFYFLSQGTFRINKRSFKRNLLLGTGINLLKDSRSLREAYCSLLNKYANPSELDTATELFPGEAEEKKITDILHRFQFEEKPIVAVGPGASFPGKCWPKEYYLQLSDRLQELGYGVVLLGSENEAEPIWISENSAIKPINLAGQLTFLESAELVKRCRLVVSNDSAVVHFGEAMGTPVISIFGPTVKEFGYAPYLTRSRLLEIPLKCRPCSRNGKGDCKNRIQRQCLREIGYETVLKEALQILD